MPRRRAELYATQSERGPRGQAGAHEAREVAGTHERRAEGSEALSRKG